MRRLKQKKHNNLKQNPRKFIRSNTVDIRNLEYIGVATFDFVTGIIEVHDEAEFKEVVALGLCKK